MGKIADSEAVVRPIRYRASSPTARTLRRLFASVTTIVGSLITMPRPRT